MEDHAERDALAGGHRAHPVAEPDAVVAVAARVRALSGGEDHERALWRALRGIPYGTTTTYGTLARELEAQPRAVGVAVGATPIPIIVPCHRVIGSDGSLTGYGGGLPRKRALLDLEAGVLPLAPV